MILKQPQFSISNFKISEPNQLLELSFIKYWENLKPGTVIKDRSGDFLIIYSPGRRNNNEGPDFLNALIWINGEAKKGDVELHVHESSWITHNHGANSRYNNVILHGVGSFAKSPVLKIPTVLLDLNQEKENQICAIPNQLFSNIQLNVLIEMGIYRWNEKVNLFHGNNEERKKIYFIETLVNFGSGENRNLYREMGTSLYSKLKKENVKQNWITRFMDCSKKFKWHKAGIMPSRHPQFIMDGIAKLTYDLFNNESNQIPLNKIFNIFKRYRFGQVSWVEWCGNVYYPFQAGYSPKCFDIYIEKWFGLKLPGIYGEVNRVFGGKLTKDQMKSYPIAQGILQLKKHYCSGWHCSVCKVKRAL